LCDAGEKGEKGDKPPKKEKGEKGEDSEKEEGKKDRDKTKDSKLPENGSLSDPAVQVDPDYQEFLEFKRYKERMRRESLNGQLPPFLTQKTSGVKTESNDLMNLLEIALEIAPEIAPARVSENVPIVTGNLIDLSDDLKGLVSQSAAQEVLLARNAALETMQLRSDSMNAQEGATPQQQGPISVRTRSGKSTDIGR